MPKQWFAFQSVHDVHKHREQSWYGTFGVTNLVSVTDSVWGHRICGSIWYPRICDIKDDGWWIYYRKNFQFSFCEPKIHLTKLIFCTFPIHTHRNDNPEKLRFFERMSFWWSHMYMLCGPIVLSYATTFRNLKNSKIPAFFGGQNQWLLRMYCIDRAGVPESHDAHAFHCLYTLRRGSSIHRLSSSQTDLRISSF